MDSPVDLGPEPESSLPNKGRKEGEIKIKKGQHQKAIETLDVVRLLNQCFAYYLKLVCQRLW